MRIRTHTRTHALSAATAATVVAAATAALTLAAPTATAAAPKPTVSDFNADGYADLAVGVPDATVDGRTRAGYVNILWGGPKGPGAYGNTRVSQARPGVPGTPEAGDRFGAAVAVADVNGDGVADLVIGAPGEDVTGSGTDAGTVAVLRGAKGGLGTATTTTNGPAASAAYGKSVTAADLTGDGRTDVAIGATDKVVLAPAGGPRSTVVSDQMGGRAPVLTTGDFDNDGTADLALAYWTVNQPYTRSHVRLWRSEPSESGLVNFWNTDNAGVTALASGDFDGDGHDDLALGECREIADENIDDPCGPEEYATGGGLHIHYGGASGFGTREQTLNQDTVGVYGRAEDGDRFGASLAVLDWNGDGRDDLLVGAPGEAIGTRAGAGAATLLIGHAGGLVDQYGEATSVAYNQGTPGIPGAAEAGDAFGTAVATGDYDHDGTPDAAIGTPGENAASGGVWLLPALSSQRSYAVTPTGLGLPSSSTALSYGKTLSSH
ncbi:FG-GAP and VCBS repeat-containing protein [Streptomyces spongiae]|uniref:Integrin-like protein n=1 Tax=Streptomyces spongiae TaxID=565072 RepID=A0A5N8XJ01_9ACTN|nr:FG-GAP and VCBS repeat-containing protein [Streptomyces spongiae]MPY59440.1 integrin-like protein [Streptomyces spongiae]